MAGSCPELILRGVTVALQELMLPPHKKTMKVSRLRAWLTVFGGFCIHLVLGTLYLWANITSAVTSRLKSFHPEITYNDTIMVFASALLAQGAMMMIGGLLSQYMGPKKTCALGGSIIVAGALGASASTTLTSLVLCQGVMLGLGLGLCYTAPITAAVRQMPDQKGLISGTTLGMTAVH
ncbi:hypothetical protein EON64_15395 [archaeon]|nr:MAG: hypothetical protein EON64_15395 [archaeon]